MCVSFKVFFIDFFLRNSTLIYETGAANTCHIQSKSINMKRKVRFFFISIFTYFVLQSVLKQDKTIKKCHISTVKESQKGKEMESGRRKKKSLSIIGPFVVYPWSSYTEYCRWCDDKAKKKRML